MTDYDKLAEDAREAHVPREAFIGYTIEAGECVDEDYVETCMCGEKYPCDAVRLADALVELKAERDQLAAQIEAARIPLQRAMNRGQWHEDGWEVPLIDAQTALDALDADPAELLREVKAAAWDEGSRAAYDYCWRAESAEAAGQGVMIQEPKNPYRKEQTSEHL